MADNDEKDDNKDEKSGSLIGEAVKKMFTVGVSAAFMTEESIRTYLSDLKLPKEALKSVLDSAQRSKEDLMGKVSNEMIKMVQKIDFAKEFTKFAETHKFKISAEIEIKKKDPSEG